MEWFTCTLTILRIVDCNGLDNEKVTDEFRRRTGTDRRQQAVHVTCTMRMTALIETSQTGRLQLTREIERTSGSVRLRMNAEKCKIMVNNDSEDDMSVIAEGAEVESVEDFCYLGSNISRPGNCDKECTMRIGKASSVVGRLTNIWKSKSISLPVKAQLYESLVISTHCIRR